MLESLQIPKRRYPCRVRDVADSLEAKDKEILLSAAENPEWPYIALENALGKLGVTVSQSSIKKHRTKVCSCFRSM
jgi:hypothetical protein